MALFGTTEVEINSIILSLKNSSACGWDGIPTSVVKGARHIIVPYFTKLCNLCIEKGIFPDIYKMSLIHPIYKDGDRKEINNYRPISMLPVLSKILEKLLNKRLMIFLENNNLISNSQFGFRKDRCTEDAVSHLISHVTTLVDSKKKVLGVFLDLKKAFDTVSVPILLNKMERCGIRGLPFNIFKSYLENRSQVTKLDGHLSNKQTMSFGVPQGSILGPSLFLIYINDIFLSFRDLYT
ncbi:hypothetical protein K1T71_011003 [Dendrolimus kikuchii]|uniref:Uncharacterized protein n=1 Tax=Dendrolimus kikuchii TaxID=765133 RepID=A0ACC1CQG4_9NEOP|nr:hypothetical protein K1T71_011003 [Dendrolimus kikuchii]